MKVIHCTCGSNKFYFLGKIGRCFHCYNEFKLDNGVFYMRIYEKDTGNWLSWHEYKQGE